MRGAGARSRLSVPWTLHGGRRRREPRRARCQPLRAELLRAGQERRLRRLSCRLRPLQGNRRTALRHLPARPLQLRCRHAHRDLHAVLRHRPQHAGQDLHRRHRADHADAGEDARLRRHGAGGGLRGQRKERRRFSDHLFQLPLRRCEDRGRPDRHLQPARCRRPQPSHRTGCGAAAGRRCAAARQGHGAGAMSPTQWLLLPAFVQVALTFAVGVRMGRARFRAARAGRVKVSEVAVDSGKWPDDVRKIANNYQNQFEVPVLYFALLPLLLATGKVDGVSVILSWAFVASRWRTALFIWVPMWSSPDFVSSCWASRLWP
ncbi:MAG: hypothetical protein EHM74_05900 [Hyphomicrobiales bacterium]|nr:MAG: hypothetical protein EHM74_05900 [Hyphomicrobiales bacterium]